MLPVRRYAEAPSTVLQDIDRMFGGLTRPLQEGLGELAATYPVDIHEEGDEVVVEAELPGFKKDDINVNIEQNVLTIDAKREAKEQKGESHLAERQYRRMTRSFHLPAPVDEDKVDAKLEEGVLTLRLPKREEARARRIEIKSGGSQS